MPQNGDKDQFDYRLSLDQNKFLGIDSENLKVTGQGQIWHTGAESGEDFTVEGPLKHFRLAFQVEQEPKTKIKFQTIDAEIDNANVAITSQSNLFKEHGHENEVKTWIQTRLSAELHKIRSEAFESRQEIVEKLPVLSLAPMIGLYFAAQLADKV